MDKKEFDLIKKFFIQLFMTERHHVHLPLVLQLWLQFLAIIFSFIYKNRSTDFFTIYWSLLLATLIYLLYYGLHHSYVIFKAKEYSDVHMDEKIDNVKSQLSPEVWLCIRYLQARVNKLEHSSPFNIGILGVFLNILFAVTVFIVSRYL